jgi:hypothetical protein
MRRYAIYSLNAPAEMVPFGIRNYIVRRMTGRSIEGSVQRACSVEYGQHVVVRVTGTPATLDDFETELLQKPPDWCSYERTHTESRKSMSDSQFKIIGSTANAESGPYSNSSSAYEYVSVSSKRSGSAKSSASSSKK